MTKYEMYIKLSEILDSLMAHTKYASPTYNALHIGGRIECGIKENIRAWRLLIGRYTTYLDELPDNYYYSLCEKLAAKPGFGLADILIMRDGDSYEIFELNGHDELVA